MRTNYLGDADDDHVPLAHAAGSADPFRRPDYHSKKHSRPMGRVRHKVTVCRDTIRHMRVESEVV